MTIMDDTLMNVLEERLGSLLTARRAGTITLEAEAEMAVISQTMTRPMPPRPPFCVLMAGLPGSGKTTLSRVLTDRGFVRLCPDEEMYRRHGVYGVDFPRGTFPLLSVRFLRMSRLNFANTSWRGAMLWLTMASGLRTTAPVGEPSQPMPAQLRYSSTSKQVTMNSGQGSTSATRTMSTIPTRSTFPRATSSATAPDSYLLCRTNRTSSSAASLRP